MSLLVHLTVLPILMLSLISIYLDSIVTIMSSQMVCHAQISQCHTVAQLTPKQLIAMTMVLVEIINGALKLRPDQSVTVATMISMSIGTI